MKRNGHLLVALLFVSTCIPTVAKDTEDIPKWTVTIADFHGSSGITYTHTITPDLIRTILSTDFEDDKPKEVSAINLKPDQLKRIRDVLNRVPLNKLEDEYVPEQPIFGGTVHFTFELPERDKKEVLVWQGARVKSLKRVVDQINKILLKKYRIRVMD